MRRTHYCGALRREHMGQAAVCCGWVQTRRDMGGVIFLDVKDREGAVSYTHLTLPTTSRV